MKRLLTGFAITLVAVAWVVGSWFFFNSIAVGAEGSGTPAVAESSPGGQQDTGADHEKCWGHGKHHGGHHRLFKELNLTDAQKNQVKSIMTEGRAKIKPLAQKLKDGRDQLRALRKAGQFDEAKVRTIAKGQADILTDMIVEKERMQSRIYAVLTPEQRAKAEQIRESWKAQHEEHSKHKE